MGLSFRQGICKAFLGALVLNTHLQNAGHMRDGYRIPPGFSRQFFKGQAARTSGIWYVAILQSGLILVDLTKHLGSALKHMVCFLHVHDMCNLSFLRARKHADYAHQFTVPVKGETLKEGRFLRWYAGKVLALSIHVCPTSIPRATSN